MAEFNSNIAINFNRFDLSEYFGTFESFDFLDGANLTIDNTVVNIDITGSYFSSDIVLWWDGLLENPTRQLVLAGDDIGFDLLEGPVAGVLTGLMWGEFVEPNVNTLSGFGFSVSVVDTYIASTTTELADDVAVLTQMLSGDDRIICSDFGDRVFGSLGNDSIFGNGGSDDLAGNAGADALSGGTQSDAIKGGNGDDTLAGNAGDDTLTAGAGDDRLVGSTGADRLTGGLGQDVLSGGNDSTQDLFVFVSHEDSAPDAARDRIMDFDRGEDQIVLSGIDANRLVSDNQTFSFGNTSAGANAIWYSAASGSATVFGDVNGDATADFSIRVAGVTSLNAADLIL